MSIGLASDAVCGQQLGAASATAPSEAPAPRRRPPAQASAHTMPGTAGVGDDRDPVARGTGCVVSSEATSNSSASVSVRITPACSNSASTVTSEADSSAPVCDEVARAPAGERPLLTARSGLLRANRRATRANFRGLPNDSRYSSATSVPGSCSQYWRKSLPDRSALFPTETNDDSPDPEPRCRLDDRDPESSALGHESRSRRRRPCGANVAFSRTAGDVLSTPRQFGPTIRIPAVAADLEQLALAVDALARRASAKPAEITTSARTPAVGALARDADHLARRAPRPPPDRRPRDVGDRAVRGQRLNRVRRDR